MKLESLQREVYGAAEAVFKCGDLLGRLIKTANAEEVPIDLQTLLQTNMDRYMLLVKDAKDKVASLADNYDQRS